MSSDIVIRAKGLGKKYVIGHHSQERYNALRDVIAQTARNLVRSAGDMLRGKPLYAGDQLEEFWALKDLSFELKRGDVIGIVGRNGAGKSTLLKVLSRITEPSAGRVEITGRLASLLEVGTGFHPELTGRENIFLNGAILGMTRTEIRRKFDEIVDFAGVEKFLDTPIKRYSSGMHVRLAFSVAAHLNPEILIVDEVLAVGDVEFQKKCIGKMQDVAGHGRTVLFVSHNPSAISSLTKKCIYLRQGRLQRYDDTDQVLKLYLSEINNSTFDTSLAFKSTNTPCAHSPAVITNLPDNVQETGAPLVVEIFVYTPAPIPTAAVSFQIINDRGEPVVHSLILSEELTSPQLDGACKLTCHIPSLRLYPGLYHLRFHFGASEPPTSFPAPKSVCYFTIVKPNERRFFWQSGSATYLEESHWTVEAMDQSQKLRTGIHT